jgi:hypothetical protein
MSTLILSPVQPSIFNALPHIDSDLPQTQKNYDEAASALIDVIKDFGLAESVSVHRVHKHFDIDSGAFLMLNIDTGILPVEFQLLQASEGQIVEV